MTALYALCRIFMVTNEFMSHTEVGVVVNRESDTKFHNTAVLKHMRRGGSECADLNRNFLEFCACSCFY